MNNLKTPFYAIAFALLFGTFACTTTDTGHTESNLVDSTANTAPDTTFNVNTDTGSNAGTGADTSMNNDGMINQGGAIIDSNNVPNKDGRLPVRGKKN